MAELSTLDQTTLSQAPLVVLAETSLTDDQATLLANYVASGGRLVAMKPDARLAATLGVASPSGQTIDGYVEIVQSSDTGSGLQADKLPFKGVAGFYQAGAQTEVVARLYPVHAIYRVSGSHRSGEYRVSGCGSLWSDRDLEF